MTILLPAADAVADTVAGRIPQAVILRYEDAPRDGLGDVTFYCLPYMGGADSAVVMASMPRLEVVQSLSSGVDDVLDAVPPQAVLCNGRGLRHEEGTAELAAILTLASLRQLPEFVRQQGQRSWRHVRTDSLEGKRVLIVGYGAIGAAVEERLKPFGARFSRVSRTARDGVAPLPRLPALAAAADVMVVCIALSAQTRGLIDAAVLAALPAGALVVNVARGPVIDAPALTAELRAGLPGGAGRDRSRAARAGPTGVEPAQRPHHAAHRRRHDRVRRALRRFRRGSGRPVPGRAAAAQHRQAGDRSEAERGLQPGIALGSRQPGQP